MEDFNHLELEALVDLLTKKTEIYTKMLTDGSSKEHHDKLKVVLKLLQVEIDTMKKTRPL